MHRQVSGIAFEKTAAWKRLQAHDEQKKNDQRDVNQESPIEITDYDVELQSLSAAEILHYSFNYIGVLTGEDWTRFNQVSYPQAVKMFV